MDKPANSSNSTKRKPSKKTKASVLAKESEEDALSSAHSLKTLQNAFQAFGAQDTDEIKKSMECLLYSDYLEEYVNRFAKICEDRVLEKMQNSPEFVQCASWSEILSSLGFRETCNNELPLALMTIAHTEKFPNPENANGVDFHLLYLNLASMMMGQPIRTMNASTQKVLKDVYEQTVLQASQADQKEEIAILHETLKTMRRPVMSDENTRRMRNISTFFSDPNINPFRLPTDQIHSCRP
ncbi:uncharacterized protein LOC128724440 [Anopheles nili]|uniref:uncharacterized protein LOC128724440 n=1 Tax=Anopheles nili TaxID=185578 RepID=UPI00237B7290|nr:uncharacterized protein LOC128724440 [Anopheles nili]